MIEGHGDDLYQYAGRIRANFSSNLTNWIDPAPLREHLRERMGEVLSVYPEPRPRTLEARLAERAGVAAENVRATNGATEAIYRIAEAFAGARSLVLQPTFSEYADACRAHGHRVGALYHLPPNGRLPEGTDLLWLCNPNNPTGSVAEKEALAALVERNRQTRFVIDQSYEDFTLKPLFTAKEAAEYPNALVIHSMTKRYAMPGLRLGYVTGPAGLLGQALDRHQPWAVNGPAIAAGLFLTEHPEAMPFDLPGCLKETARLRKLLQATGRIEAWETDTHFLLGRLRNGQASALKRYLAEEHGILIRDASNFEGLDKTFFRVSTQRPENNDRLAEAIAQWFEN